ncbi:MAG: hypothetical protein RIQ59_1675 [Bacteroidota bacterium]|jgi:hypothetical protein
MNINNLAENKYKYFCEREGNDHISSIYALKIILKLILDFKVKSVLELGLGIGSISDTILTFSQKNKIKYVGTETNEFCLQALNKNVEYFSDIEVFSSLSEIKINNKFDLIIVDGSDDELINIENYCSKNTLLFIEGYRILQVEIIKNIFPNCIHVEIISKEKNPNYGPFSSSNWSGGGQLIFINPNSYQKLYWFNEKVKSYFKRRLRRFV